MPPALQEMLMGVLWMEVKEALTHNWKTYRGLPDNQMPLGPPQASERRSLEPTSHRCGEETLQPESLCVGEGGVG